MNLTYITKRQTSSSAFGGLLAITISLFASTASAQILTLDNAITKAITNNPSIQSAREMTKAAKARVPQAITPENPTATVEFEKTPINTLNVDEAMSINYGVKQTIPFPSKLVSSGKAAKNEYHAAYQMQKQIELNITSEIKKIFADIMLVDKEIEIENKNRALFSRFTKVAEVKYSTGLSTFDEPVKASIEAADFEAKIAMLEAEHESLLANLEYLLNEEMPRDTKFEAPKEPEFNHTLEDLKSLAEKNQPELIASLFEKSAAKSRLSLAKQQYLPDLMAEFSYNQQKNLQNAWTGAVGVSVPLWFLGKQAPAVREASAMKKASENNYLNTKNRLNSAVAETFERIRSSGRIVEIYKTTILPKSRAALKSTELSYSSGKRDFIDLLDAARKWREYEIDYYRALADKEKAIAEMETLVGKRL
ncbi:MAG: TolC family protein [Deltaproteobacteria bacterium]|nr:TolC family protein [Deltaproteobacteria bacterium]